MNLIEQILNAQIEQLENPTRACVNSEHSFVKQTLMQQGYREAAALYWNFICGGKNLITDVEVLRAAKQLTEIDNASTMPSWGHAGT